MLLILPMVASPVPLGCSESPIRDSPSFSMDGKRTCCLRESLRSDAGEASSATIESRTSHNFQLSPIGFKPFSTSGRDNPAGSFALQPLLPISCGFHSRGQLINEYFKKPFPGHAVVLFLG